MYNSYNEEPHRTLLVIIAAFLVQFHYLEAKYLNPKPEPQTLNPKPYSLGRSRNRT